MVFSGAQAMSNVGVVVTGVLGHRGVSAEEVMASLAELKVLMPGSPFIFATHNPLSQDHLEVSKGVFDSIIVLPPPRVSGLVPYMASLVFQCQQVTHALATLPPRIAFVARIRTDWIIRDPRKIATLLAQLPFSGSLGLAVCSVSMKSFGGPLGHVPWFANDHLMFGRISDLSRFWAEADPEYLKTNQGVKIASRQVLVKHRVILHPEQILWHRFFTGQLPSEKKVHTAQSIRDGYFNLSRLQVYSPTELGVMSPQGVEPLGGMAKMLAKCFPKDDSGFSRRVRVAAFIILCKFMFWLSPDWWLHRIKWATENLSRSKSCG